MTDLSILCVTRNDAIAEPFLADMQELAEDLQARFVLYKAPDAGDIGRVLDEAVSLCPDGYILRLDDDERVSYPMYKWLLDREYRAADHWAFPRMNLWPDKTSYITNQPLWPDLQTRLSLRGKSGGRAKVHAASPYGTGRNANVPIEHHKFLVRTMEERRQIAATYERLQPGAGSGHFLFFSLPEMMGELQLAPCAP